MNFIGFRFKNSGFETKNIEFDLRIDGDQGDFIKCEKKCKNRRPPHKIFVEICLET